MNFDNKVKKILKELYPNDYNFDGNKDDGGGFNFDVFAEMMQIIKIFQTHNNIEPASEVEQKLKKLYSQWPGTLQDAVVHELMVMAKDGEAQGNHNMSYVANTILSIIVPSANDEKDPSPMGATVYDYSDSSTVAMQIVKDYVELRKINIKDAEGIVRLRWSEVNQALKDGVIDALITLSKADPTAGKDDGKNNVGLLAREILTIILNEDV